MYKHNGRRVFSIWIDEDLLLKLDKMAEELNTSINSLIVSAVEELVAAWELAEEMGYKTKTTKRRFALKSVFTRFKARFSRA